MYAELIEHLQNLKRRFNNCDDVLYYDEDRQKYVRPTTVIDDYIRDLEQP